MAHLTKGWITLRGQGRLSTNQLTGSLPTLPPPFSFPPSDDLGREREREREGLSSVPDEYMYSEPIYIMYIFTVYTTSPHSWAWWCTCWAATTGPRWNCPGQPRQHPSNKTE